LPDSDRRDSALLKEMTNAPRTDTASARTRSPGDTTGTFLRPPQHLAEAFAAFDIREEADVLLEEARYLPDRRSSKTLVKLPELRIILTAACAGTSTGRHRTHAPVSVQCLSGLIHINAGDSQVELDQAGLATFGADVEHRVTAVTDAAFLTTVAWSESSRP
jgi:quercetin dioxygenase-like cupin family protein